MNKAVGFDQKIQLSHLDITAQELRYTEKKDMYAKLDEYLRSDIKGDKSRKNAITMLMKIWCMVEPEYQELQGEALQAFPQASAQERILLHWGLTLLAYPFFKCVIEEMGNLLKLQNEVSSQQLNRRIKLLYGDRRRVEVAVSAVLGSLKAWGLIEHKGKNIYTLPGRINVEGSFFKNWILEVLLRVSEYNIMPVDMLNSQAAFFPFEFEVSITELDGTRIKVDRQGLDQFMLSL